MDIASHEQILKACTLLLGTTPHTSLAKLKQLGRTGLKTAFKKRAMECHPDRATTLGREPELMKEEFQLMHEAFLILRSYFEQVECEDAARIQGGISPVEAESNRSSGHFYQGPLPSRRLPLGLFLYYSRRISWETLMAAVLWQSEQRPRIGQIAIELGFMSPRQVGTVLRHKTYHEPFGTRAHHMGLISATQCRRLLTHQKQLQPPIGRYFVSKGILSSAELKMTLKKQRIHNSTVEQNGSHR